MVKHALGVLLISGLLAGCSVTSYQSLSALQSPVALDLNHQNLVGNRIQLQCVLMDTRQRRFDSRLCDLLTRLFEQQGAVVAVDTGDGDRGEGQNAAKELVDLKVAVSSDRLVEKNSFLESFLHIASFTLFPSETHLVYRLRLTITEADGFLLGDQTYLSRVTEVNGVGYYVTNWLVNMLVRSDAAEVTSESAKLRLSNDYYAHVVQEVLNASMKRKFQTQRVARDEGKP